jgi:hypothetical protein
MLQNKNNIRSVANNLQVRAAPEYLSTLNKFKLALIRCVMPCLTILKLGQIMGSKRPATELTNALK